MDAERDGFRNAQRAIHATARTAVIEHDDARFVEEQPPNEVVAHVPECRQLIDRKVALKRGTGCAHRIGRRHVPLGMAKSVTGRHVRFPEETQTIAGARKVSSDLGSETGFNFDRSCAKRTLRPVNLGALQSEVSSTMNGKFDRITQDQKILGGRAAIRGLRISVAHVVNLVANGMTPTEVVVELPDLEEEDVRQALAYAAALAQDEVHPIRA